MPMPRFTSIPERSSHAMRLAMTVCASITSPIGNEKVDERGRGHNVIGRDYTHRHDMVRGHDDSVRRHGDERIEIACSKRVGQIAYIVGEKRMNQREIGAQSGL